MSRIEIESTAQALVAHCKGILAADESIPTIARRFEAIDLDCSFETRRAFRALLFAAPDLGKYISGAIMHDETIRQRSEDGVSLVKLQQRQHIIPGIKVDMGTKPLAGCPGETVTEGLDGLRGRLAEYRAQAARFAKWRAVIRIGDGMPSGACLAVNAHALARFAALCQEEGLVPIVEPEVLMDGGHEIDACEQATKETLRRLFDALNEQRVELEGMLLKPNMVVSGKECPYQAGVAEVAERTLHCLRRTVPAAVPGIVFLSGGQSSESATAHLNAMNAGFGPHPWKLSFSFGRALQDQALRAWRGIAAYREAAQELLVRRARLNSAAAGGRYIGEAG